ncbi:MAG: copper chaperone PCu(A)C [Leptospiraceae bacterium]|nr:copper chaperone PCu(A)C [Leptospiraceae bacterium]
MKVKVLLTLFIFFLSCKGVKETGLKFENPVIRLVPEVSNVTAGFLKIHNHTGKNDRLINATSSISEITEIHEMFEEEGMMKMRRKEGGIVIPNETFIELKPGAEHIMFINLKKPLVKGEKVMVELVFQNEGLKKVEFEVKELEESMPHKH